ncbi:hypothetical protein [Mariniflexile sp. HMF6888]|uniref:hypothetical protein n=1 Tax=Mariniflexile sp. HMF6888 TaxID=3373086 RepID=UPI0037B6024D
MKILTIIIVHLICINGYSQKTKTQYFLIDTKDTLIRKQVETKKNKFQGYTIIDEYKIIKKYNAPSKIDGDDIKVNSFDSLTFAFYKDNDTVVDETYIKKIDVIKTRREFLKINSELDETKNRFIFIEPLKCGKFILREVRPVIFE